METARKRIIHFIENQRIKPSDFLLKTGLKKGFIDKSHQESGASDIALSKILEHYPNLSAKWLLTGKGEMMLENINEPLTFEKNTFKDVINSSEVDLLKKLIESQNKTIEAQKIAIESLQSENLILKEGSKFAQIPIHHKPTAG